MSNNAPRYYLSLLRLLCYTVDIMGKIGKIIVKDDFFNETALVAEARQKKVVSSNPVDMAIACAAHSLDCAEITKKMHRKNMYLFLDWVVHEIGESKRFHRDIFLDYKNYLRDRSMSNITKNKRLAAARFFIYWVYRNHPQIIDRDITLGIPSFKVLRKPKEKAFTSYDIRKIWRAIDALQDGHGKDNLRVLFCFLIHQGMRAGEIMNATFKGVSFKDKTLTLENTKKQADEIIVLHEDTVKALRAAQKHEQWSYAFGDRPCVVSRTGDRIKHYATLRKLADQVLLGAGAGAHTLHAFRGYAITRMAKKGIWLARRFARHSDLNTTSGYVHLTDDDLRKQMAVKKRGAKRKVGAKVRKRKVRK